ncbi:MAG: hypothetical protein WAL56_15760 [Candidatus Sulfotelmatobacter sp.]
MPAAQLDLESNPIAPGFPHAGKQVHIVLPDLSGAQVYALGVDGTGRTITYWQSLQQFWVEYLLKSGANLRGFSILRDLVITQGMTPAIAEPVP